LVDIVAVALQSVESAYRWGIEVDPDLPANDVCFIDEGHGLAVILADLIFAVHTGGSTQGFDKHFLALISLIELLAHGMGDTSKPSWSMGRSSH
jgi:hypothetical protein